jgi:hypothetical protein
MKLISLIIVVSAIQWAVLMLPVAIMVLRSDQRALIGCAKLWIFLGIFVRTQVKKFPVLIKPWTLCWISFYPN